MGAGFRAGGVPGTEPGARGLHPLLDPQPDSGGARSLLPAASTAWCSCASTPPSSRRHCFYEGPDDSLARGNALFGLSAEGSELHYKLIVANIENVVASHIHLGPAGANGPVVAFLYGPAAPGGGRTDGVLAEGTITAANLVGPLAGRPLGDLIAAMEAGNAYVNVHTNDGVAPPNTGPGDFPGGEVRGQIRVTP